MIDVMLVDDEPYVRHMIRSMADWQAMDMRVAAEAYNGKTALDCLSQSGNQISLVITDLKMPGLDGLELIQRALVHKPDLEFIVVSAYDDFHLVKEAFKLGARDYLLKSEITEKQLENVLRNMHGRILDRRSAASVPGGPSAAPGPDGEKILAENLLTRFVNGDCNMDDLKILRQLIRFQPGMRLSLSMMRLIHGPANDNGTDSHKAALCAALAQASHMLVQPEKTRRTVAQITPDVYCALTIYSVGEPASAIMKYLRSAPEGFASDGVLLNVGLSHIATDFSLLPRLVREAKIAMEYCFVQGNGSVVRYDSLIEQPSLHPVDPAVQTEALKKCLQSFCLREKAAGFGTLMLEPDAIHVGDIGVARELFMKYHFILTDFARANRLEGETLRLLRQYDADLKYGSDLRGLNHWLSAVLESIMESLGGNRIISQVKNYIGAHYGENIGLSSVAACFHLNSSYLSRIFSENERVSFVDYLCHVRVTKAIELMQSSNLKIYEICEKVGYVNPEHFSRMFKKLTGKSPKQFMQSGTAD